MDEFTIRTGVYVSHWLSQSIKRGEVAAITYLFYICFSIPDGATFQQAK